jgi:tRNA splicing endonuclease
MEPLQSNADIFTKIVFHRMKIEQNEQTRNQEFTKQKNLKIEKLTRAAASFFRPKYQTNELYSELRRYGVVVRKDELMLALTSMTT